MTKKVTVFCDVNFQIPLSIEVEVEESENLEKTLKEVMSHKGLINKNLKERFNLWDLVNARVLKYTNQYFNTETNEWVWLTDGFTLAHNGNYPEESPFVGVRLEDVIQRGEYVYVKENAIDKRKVEGVVDGD